MGHVETISEHRCHGGLQGFYRHQSEITGLPMRFAVYQPPQVARGPVPVLFYLAGLSCTEETFAMKGGAQRHAAKHGLMLVSPDTSPRDPPFEGADAGGDFGVGASFYLDASQLPWANHWRMESYLIDELPALICETFPGDIGRMGIFGHSMGGHGALTLALRHSGRYRSVSAFAPIAAPMAAPWGIRAFTGYLGLDQAAWREHDATELIKAGKRAPALLIDQGLADRFLAEELGLDAFERACTEVGQALTVRRHEGYDHGYYFISTFMADHIELHARSLN